MPVFRRTTNLRIGNVSARRILGELLVRPLWRLVSRDCGQTPAILEGCRGEPNQKTTQSRLRCRLRTGPKGCLPYVPASALVLRTRSSKTVGGVDEFPERGQAPAGYVNASVAWTQGGTSARSRLSQRDRRVWQLNSVRKSEYSELQPRHVRDVQTVQKGAKVY